MHDEVLDRLLHIVDFEHSTIVGKDLALIGELATGLRIERSAVENDFDGGRTGDCGDGALPSCMMPSTLARADMSV